MFGITVQGQMIQVLLKKMMTTKRLKLVLQVQLILYLMENQVNLAKVA